MNYSRKDWRNQAACRNADPELFFVAGGERPTRALAYCKECPVRLECLDEAMTVEHFTKYNYGIFGGMTPKQRSNLRRKGINFDFSSIS